MFKKILIANRGEIACRVIRTARRMGIATVAVYSDADADALHVREADEAVRIGPPPSAESYLDIDAHRRGLPQDRRRGGASRLRLPVGEPRHSPQALAKAGIIFIGPPAQAIAAMGDKIESKKLARAAGVSTVPGHLDVIPDADAAVAIARDIGYPGHDQGLGRRRRQGHADRRERRRGRATASARPRTRRNRALPTTASSSRNTSRSRATSRSRCSATRTATSSISASANARSSAATRRSSRRRRARFSTPRRAQRWARRRSRWRKAVDYRSAGTVEFIVDQQAQFLFPRDEHAAPGRAPGDRAGDRPRSRRADDPHRRRRDAAVRAEGREARRAGRSRRGSMPRTRCAISCRRSAASCAIGRRAATASASTPASSKAPRSASTTTR